MYYVPNTCVGRLFPVCGANGIRGSAMKACLLRTPGRIETNPLEFEEVVEPKPASGEVLAQVRMCGVCRTDLHVIEGELPPKKSPIIPGHQVVGVVEHTSTADQAKRTCAMRLSLRVIASTEVMVNGLWHQKHLSIRYREVSLRNRPRRYSVLESSGTAA